MYATRIRIVLTTNKAGEGKSWEVVKEHEHGIIALGLQNMIKEAIEAADGDHVYVERIDCEVSSYPPPRRVTVYYDASEPEPEVPR
jgi:hypothetical protein